eukprot:3086423-Alexandrium_andersonii.AAC.1
MHQIAFRRFDNFSTRLGGPPPPPGTLWRPPRGTTRVAPPACTEGRRSRRSSGTAVSQTSAGR